MDDSGAAGAGTHRQILDRGEYRQAAGAFAEAVTPLRLCFADPFWGEGPMSLLRAVVAVVIAACVADCAGERTQIANYAQNKMIGLTPRSKSLLAWDRQLPKQQRVQPKSGLIHLVIAL